MIADVVGVERIEFSTSGQVGPFAHAAAITTTHRDPLLDGSCVTNPVYSDPTLLATDPDIVTTTVRNDPTVEAVIRQATTNILNMLLGGPAASHAHDPSYPLAPGA